MNLIPLSDLKALTGYNTRKSVKRWLKRELGLSLIRIGRHYGIPQDQFEKAMSRVYTLKISEAKYQPKHAAEKAFLQELSDLTSTPAELPCPSTYGKEE